MKQKIYLILTYVSILFINVNSLYVANASISAEEIASREQILEGYNKLIKPLTPEDAWLASRIKLTAEDAWLFFHRGDAYERLDKNEEALADYNRAIELDPAYMNALVHRALLYYKLGKQMEALAGFAMVEELQSKQAVDYNRPYEQNSEFVDEETVLEETSKS